jgi:hypothetical protein
VASKTAQTSPPSSKKAEDGDALRSFGEERLVARRELVAYRRNRHVEGSHELELIGRQLNGRPTARTSSILAHAP